MLDPRKVLMAASPNSTSLELLEGLLCFLPEREVRLVVLHARVPRLLSLEQEAVALRLPHPEEGLPPFLVTVSNYWLIAPSYELLPIRDQLGELF